jgi:hypothetical protein
MKIKIGSQVGNWKVISDKFKNNNIYWNTCECICGKLTDVRTWHLEHYKTISCGCSNTKTRFKAKSIGNLSSSYFTSFKNSRIKKGKIFSDDITMQYLWKLFLDQNGLCALSGINIFLNPQWSQQNKGIATKIIQTASLDRIDNNKGYEIENLHWVHKDVNLMKGCMSQKDFINFCKLIAMNNMTKNDDISITSYSKWFNTNKKINYEGSTNL